MRWFLCLLAAWLAAGAFAQGSVEVARVQVISSGRQPADALHSLYFPGRTEFRVELANLVPGRTYSAYAFVEDATPNQLDRRSWTFKATQPRETLSVLEFDTSIGTPGRWKFVLRLNGEDLVMHTMLASRRPGEATRPPAATEVKHRETKGGVLELYAYAAGIVVLLGYLGYRIVRRRFPGFGLDRSTSSLIAANALTIGVAYATGMSFLEVLLVYWTQSVIIGVCTVVRLQRLKRFSVSGITNAGVPARETPEEKRSVVVFFISLHGGAHAIYAVFLAALFYKAGQAPSFPVADAICAAAFALDHAYALHLQMKVDAESKPHLGAVIRRPVMRTLLMHVILIFGVGLMSVGVAAMLFFLIAKTFADVIMHRWEQDQLARARREDDFVG